MTTVFVAGSRKLGRLNEDIKQRLDNIISKGYMVVVGDANGADKAMQKYFNKKKYSDIVVYYASSICRNNIGKWATNNVVIEPDIKGRKLYTQKDIKMAEDADYGLMLWDGKSSGTLNNILELLKRNKKALVYLSPEKNFYSITNVEEAKDLLEKCDAETVDKIKKKVNLSTSFKEIYKGAQDSFDF